MPAMNVIPSDFLTSSHIEWTNHSVQLTEIGGRIIMTVLGFKLATCRLNTSGIQVTVIADIKPSSLI